MKGHGHLIILACIIVIFSRMQTIIWAICFMLWLYLLYRKKRVKKKVLVTVIGSFIFFTLFLTAPNSDNGLLAKTDYKQSYIDGTIVSEVKQTKSKIEFILEENEGSIRTLVVFFLRDEFLPQRFIDLKNGATCTIYGKKTTPAASRNPAQFDYQNYLQQQNIQSQLIVNNPEDMECTGSAIINNVYEKRNRILNYVEGMFSQEINSWMRALLFGDDSFITDETVELFQRWNLSHLLAISGLHVGLIVSFIYLCLVKLGITTKEKAQWIIIICLLIYPLLAGGAPSVWRACLMTMIAMLFLKIKRKVSITDVLSVVFVLYIIVDQSVIYQLGFQFSFLVTFALLLSNKIFTETASKSMLLMRISYVSQMILLPLQINHFYFFNPLSFVVNLALVPYFTVIFLPMLLIFLIASLLLPQIVPFLDIVFIHFHQMIMTCLEEVDQRFFYPWVLGEFPNNMMIVYFVVFSLIMLHMGYQKYRKAFHYGCLLICILVVISVKPYLNPQGSVTMLDVGQGDSFIIELPFRKGVVMIDAAGSMASDFESVSDKNYKQIIKPYLYSKGITTIDLLFLSHEDVDHIGSVPFIIEEFNVEKMIVSDQFNLAEFSETLIPIQTVKSGEKIQLHQQLFYVLHPEHSFTTTNDNSLVLFTQLGGLNWLFTGDIGSNVELTLTKRLPNLQVDVLKVSHHGSKTSTSAPFIESINPHIALISVGVNNRYGHPNQKVLETLTQKNVQVMRTDQLGAVQYKFLGDSGTFSSYLPYDIVKTGSNASK